MTLKDLEAFDPVTIQCHDNPDADALGAGFGLYAYFKSLGRQTRLIYSGRNPIQKSNLKIMTDELHIPVEYVRPDEEQPLFVKGLLVTVDCQYGAGNVTKIEADTVAIVDHHQVEIDGVPLSLIVPALGSCCTLVWKLLRDAKFDIKTEPGLETALYYGLYTDTNQLSEIRNPLDMDMRDDLAFDAGLINYFKNSNLSLKELEIAGEPERFIVPDFKTMPAQSSVFFHKAGTGAIGKVVDKIMFQALTPCPKVKKNECIGCGKCANICPAKAIRMENKLPTIDRKACIHCFCCQEFCPKGAMGVSRPFIARLLNQ